MNIKLDSDTISSMNVFSDVTSVVPRDCINSTDKIIFIVNQGQAGIAIGKNGTKTKMLQDMLKKTVLIIEYSDDPVKFLENILWPEKLVSGYVASNIEEGKKLEASVHGKINNSKLKLAKTLMQRYFNIISINIR
jgi:N utilization substance protein A